MAVRGVPGAAWVGARKERVASANQGKPTAGLAFDTLMVRAITSIDQAGASLEAVMNAMSIVRRSRRSRVQSSASAGREK